MDLFNLLDGITFWHWLAFGFVLLAVELLGTAGYFLWLGLSALLVGALLAVLPFRLATSMVIFRDFQLADNLVMVATPVVKRQTR